MADGTELKLLSYGGAILAMFLITKSSPGFAQNMSSGIILESEQDITVAEGF